MSQIDQIRARSGDYSSSDVGASSVNKVLKNTYMLLSMTLAFSGVVAWASMVTGFGMAYYWPLVIAMFVSLFAIRFTAKSAWGLVMVFVFTGLMGATIGPLLSIYLAMSNGPTIVMQAMGGTAVIFLSLSAYALVSKKDFSFMGGFLFVGLIVAVLAMVLNIFLRIPALDLALSAVIILIMSGFILFDTSRIIRGGETNYIMATVSLYLNIVNIFVSLLRILGAGGDD